MTLFMKFIFSTKFNLLSAIFLIANIAWSQEDSLYIDFDTALKAALANNVDVQETKFAWISQNEVVKGSYGDFEPKLVGRLNKERGDNPSSMFTETKDEYKLGVQGNLPTGTSYDVGFNQATYTHSDNTSELYFGGELRQHILKNGPIYQAPMNTLKQAKMQSELAYQKYRNAITEVLEKFCDAYWEYYYAEQLLHFAEQSADVAKNIAEDASKRLQMGLLSALDQQKAVAEYSDRESARFEALDNKRNARLKLLLTIAAPEYMKDSRPIALHPNLEIDSIVPADSVSLMDSIKFMHPLYLQQSAELSLRETVLESHQSEFLPTLDVICSYGIRSRNANAKLAVKHFKEPEQRRKVFSGGVEIEVPLFANTRERHQITAEKANVRSAVIRQQLILNQLFEEYRILNNRANEIRKQHELSSVSVKFHETELAEEFKKMSLGKSNYHQIFEIEEDLRESQKRHLETVRQLHVIDVRAQKAKGKLLLQNGLEDWRNGKLTLREDLLHE